MSTLIQIEMLRPWALLQAVAALCACEAFGEPKPNRTSAPQPGETLIVFLIDNSASLPPLDPTEKRREALEKIFTFIENQPYRLVLFGGRREISLDKPENYRNTGQWTDFYFAVRQVQEIIAAQPKGTEVKLILVTDGVLDPAPNDWKDQDLPEGTDLKATAAKKTVDLLAELKAPLYVLLIGHRVDSDLVTAMVRAANGPLRTSQYSQGLADFFADDGLLFKRFVYRVEPQEGLAKVEKVVRRIAAPPRARVELSLGGAALLMVGVIIGVSVRSFPGAGDQELLDLRFDEPVHVAVDRFRRLSSNLPAWSWRGLSAVESAKDAAATLTLMQSSQDFPSEGFDLSRLDATARELVDLSVPALHERLEQMQRSGNKDEMIYALNLDYVARNFNSGRAERLLTSPASVRRKEDPADFLRAKVHLLYNDTLYQKLTGPRVSCLAYGSGPGRQDLRKGSPIQLGRYLFTVSELGKGGRRDLRLVLAYEKVPSLLWLKNVVPGRLQRLLRLRRSHERTVI
jgi:hypothetical protein